MAGTDPVTPVRQIEIDLKAVALEFIDFSFGNEKDDSQRAGSNRGYTPHMASQGELKQDLNEVDDYLRLGWEYYVIGDYDKAAQILADGKESFPEDVEILYALALALKKGGEMDKALSNFRRVTLFAEKLQDRSRSRVLRRLAIGHANVITEGDWNLSGETWETT